MKIHLKSLLYLIYTILLLLISMPSLLSQAYSSLLTDGNLWLYRNAAWEFGEVYSTTDIKVFIAGDSIENGEIYKKLFIYDEDQINTDLFALLRQDSTQKIWARMLNGAVYHEGINCTGITEEFLLYDFQVEEGDTIFNCVELPYYALVESIDSILLGNDYRKRINFTTFNQETEDKWIEGVGSIKGLFGPILFDEIDNGWELLCFKMDSTYAFEPNYTDLDGTFDENCNIVVSSFESSKKEWQVYPNPAHQQLLVETGDDKITAVKIFDLQGELLLEKNINTSFKTLDITFLNKGIYLLAILEKEKWSWTKFVKQ